MNMYGGEGGIRTPGSLATTSDFESGAFNRSATSPTLECMRCARRYAASAQVHPLSLLAKVWRLQCLGETERFASKIRKSGLYSRPVIYKYRRHSNHPLSMHSHTSDGTFCSHISRNPSTL